MLIKLKLTRATNLAHYGVPAGTVVSLDLDGEYMPICIASEIYENNARTPPEAKKAQAVASRNYIVAKAGNGQIIDDTTKYQAFSWKDPATIPNCVAAVRATATEVLMYGGKPITAWYSNSNGGQAKSSKEVWGTATAWTASRPDPWDVAGREKWGQTSASHSVGMSQIGAAYAAYAGKSYEEILAFYYPNTTIHDNYGETPKTGGTYDMADTAKTNTGLVSFSQNLLGQAYWYGTCCYKCTTSLLNTKAKQYPAYYTSDRMPQYNRDIQSRKTCADCIGLIKGYLWDQNGTIVYDATSDVNTTGLYNRSTIVGMIETLPEVPGLITYKSGHVGVYEGNGNVIEAKGFHYGIIRSKLSEGPWTHWLACPFLSYAGFESLLGQEAFAGAYLATVTTSSSPLNIWSDSTKTRSLLQVKKGDAMTVIGYASPIGWLQVEKNGVHGVADGRYLMKSDAQEVEDDADDKDPSAKPDETPDEEPNVDMHALYHAEVTGVKVGLNLRTSPELTNNTLLLLPRGAVVDVLQDNIAGGFDFVRYGSVVGYATAVFLKRVEVADTAGE